MAEKQKYQFNGQTYTVKGRLCHDIVKYYVEQNPNATLAALQKAFNTATHLIVATPEMALTVVNSDGKAGGDYYMKEADQIAIKKGKVVVWSYWPESYFKPFMVQVKALGIMVEGDFVSEQKELSLGNINGKALVIAYKTKDCDGDIADYARVYRFEDNKIYSCTSNMGCVETCADIPSLDEEDWDESDEMDFEGNYKGIHELADSFVNDLVECLWEEGDYSNDYKAYDQIYHVTIYDGEKIVYSEAIRHR